MRARRMSKRTAIAIFAVAFVMRLAIAGASGMLHRASLTEMEGIAWNVVGLGHYGLVYPGGLYYGPTAYSTPPFPLALALLMVLLGKAGFAYHLAIVTLACAASALRCALLPLFAGDAGFDSRTAKIAGWLSVIYIAAFDTEMDGGLDGPYVALGLLLLLWWAMRIWRDGSWQ